MISRDDIVAMIDTEEQMEFWKVPRDMKYQSTKTYGHNIGLSACFRQPNAHSHCKFLHGYSLQFKFTFQARELDERHWVVDFGGLKPLKAWLEETFDHKVVLDTKDPYMDTFKDLHQKGLAELTVLDGVGVEKFAEHAFNFANKLVDLFPVLKLL